ncbi:hypothetical protein CIHG_10360 [Coccidioides immitis H538.4]|uniref:Uncharacterized protein n=1 Tax=Coccidioides immitis H538.4 TaxID=396776 RepID=A0A0J8S6X4_COCIT|nr:hypothetical protein CIHG_10360 [Coccidioides immitis H538.4]
MPIHIYNSHILPLFFSDTQQWYQHKEVNPLKLTNLGHQQKTYSKNKSKFQEKLNTLQAIQKYLQSEFLNIVIFNPTPVKHPSVLRSLQHMKLYQTGFYTKYQWFISSIESTHNTSKLNNEKTLTYTLTELDYIEKDLWKIYHENNPLKNN